MRVTRVCVNIQRVEVIGHIEHAEGKAQGIFLVNFHVLGSARVGGEKDGITKSVAIRHSHIIAGRIDGRIGEPRMVFDDGGQSHMPRQREKAPGKETIWKIAGQLGELIGLNHRRRKISQIFAEIIEIPMRAAPNVGQENLLTATRRQHCGDFQLPVLRTSVAAEHERIILSNHLRIQDNDATRIVRQVVQPYPHLRRENMFRFDLPGSAVGREVARVCASFDEQKSPTEDCFGQIDKESGSVDDVSCGPIRRDDLFGVAAEGINAQWEVVIIDSVAAADYCRTFF